MAARTVHDFVAMETPSAAVFDADPRGWQGYLVATSNQSGISTETDLTALSALSVTVLTGRVIKVTAHCMVESTVTDDVAALRLYQDGVQLTSFRQRTGGSGRGMSLSWVGTPAAGAHTYKLTLTLVSGTGTLTLSAGSTAQAMLLVEDIGASS